jgi:autoinducer-2 kinase
VSSDPTLLTIDAGTGSVRAILFDARYNQVASASREYSHPTLPDHPGGQSFDTRASWGLVAECVREVLAGSRPDQIAAVSATSMREGMVLYDEAGDELWACPNSDSRAPEESAELIEEGAAERIYELAGDWIAITAPPRLRWLRRHEPELLERVRHMTMLSDWILYRLSGEFVTDPTVGSSSAMFDLRRRGWSEEIVAICGLDPAVLPPVVEPGTRIGAVTPAAAAETGLAPGTPVVVGGADTQLGLLGLDIQEAGSFAVLGGTFWQTTLLLDEPLVDPGGRLRTLCHVGGDRWMVEGIGFWCGLTMRWLRDAFCAAELERARSDGGSAYALMEQLAAGVPPGAHGVTAIFSDLMNAKRWVHAAPALVGFDVTSPATSGKAEAIRAVEECAAYVVRGHLQLLQQITGYEPERITFAGGAAQGELWPQIVADVTGCPVDVPEIKESTCLGTAVCAAVGAGLHADLDAATAALPGIERRLEPQPEATRAYQQLYEQWGELYRHALDAVERGLAKPLWKAAGT